MLRSQREMGNMDPSRNPDSDTDEARGEKLSQVSLVYKISFSTETIYRSTGHELTDRTATDQAAKAQIPVLDIISFE